MTTEPTPPSRRWFQYRLRTLLIVMLVVSLGMGWVMKERRRIAARRDALKTAGFDELFIPNVLLKPRWREHQASWSIILLGGNWPEFAMAISCRSDGTTDADLVHLVELTQLQELHLSGTRVTDAGLMHLRRLTQLQWLYLDGTQATDTGVARLQAALPNCNVYR
jgi:hypothetical protein